jgi:hypothetical protein
MIKVLGVHGIGNDRPDMSDVNAADDLRAVWQHGLRDGLGEASDSIDLEVAYYAPALRSDQAQGADPFAEMDDGAGWDLLRWVGHLGAPAEVAQGRVTQPLRQAVDWIARHFGLDNHLVAIFVATFCREVRSYLREPSARPRLAARQAVGEVIARNEPRAIVAHSLGSVVTYESLWELADIHVELLITVGSPLALPDLVFERLVPSPIDGWGRKPPNVDRWINVADVGDLVAVPRWLSRRFIGVDEDIETVIGPFDFHRVRRYLRSKAIGDALKPLL